VRALFKVSAMATTFLLCATAPDASIAQQAQKSKQTTAPAKAAAPQPFELVMGKSTTTDAQAIWKREGGKVIGEGYGDAKPSSSDNDPDGVANRRIVLIDVQGLPLERLESARFGFFDNTLYLVQYMFEGGADFDKLFLQVSSKYGPPQRKGGFGDEFFEWRFDSVVLSMEKKFIGQHSMTFLHEPTLRSAKASNADVYATHVKAKAQKQKGF
jgi:hypothetical protein